jgi:uridine kinase
MARWQPARADVIAEYAREVLSTHPRGRVVVGLDGIEAPAATDPPSGREAFAADLAAAIRAEGVPAVAVPMGRFAARPTAADPARFFDEGAFRDQVLTPFRRGALEGAEADRAALVVSGPFLHFGDLAGIWHTSAWLQLSREDEAGRDAARVPGFDGAAWSALVDLAFRRLDARKLAKASFDLADPAHPRRRFEDAC